VDREVQQLRVQLYRVNGSDSNRKCNCDTAEGSNCNCELYECKSECGINSLNQIMREVICRLTYTQHVTILYIEVGTKS
jgi:hypothetical protein